MVVHGRREHQRPRVGQRGTGEQVVGQAAGQLRKRVGRGRRHAQHVAAAHQLEVRDRVVVGRGVAREGAAGGVALELVHQHRRAGHALEGRLAHELQAGGRLDHAHGVAGAGGQPDQLHRLVGGDSPGNPKKQACHHR